jgi:twitching motility protein PilT
MQRINDLLKRCVDMHGSDLHFKCDTGKVYVRVHGDLVHLEDEPFFSDAEFREQLSTILRPDQMERFDRELELDFAYEMKGISRFRGNAYQQRNHMQAAFRVIPYYINSMEDLQLPQACYDFIQRPRGLVLVTGPAGSGKSTSLAAMVARINETQKCHIMTVEDPIEFVHDNQVALINQRELEVDTKSFANALKYVLRQDPDVILVGEMRDLETIHLAITAAETGHLVFATLHTVDAVQTVDRIVDVFPMHQQQQVRMQLSVNLVGVISQTLVKRKDGRGRAAAFEVLVATGAVRNLVRENKTYQISSLIQTGGKQKMQTLDQSLTKLVEMGIVTTEDARSRAKDAGEFDRLMETTHAPTDPNSGGEAFQLGVAPPAAAVRGQPNRPGYKRE